MSKRAYKFRFYPIAEQKDLLARTFGCVRFVYNTILQWRTDQYFEHKTKIGFCEASKQLTQLKRESQYTWLNEVSCVPLQQCLRHQQNAFTNFFQKRARYPKFKKKHSHQSAEFTRKSFHLKDGNLFIAKCSKPLTVRWSQELPSSPSSITIICDSAGRYFVSLLCEFEPERLTVSPKTVGVDLGISALATLSTGEKIDNPKYFKKLEKKLAKSQRALSRKKKGSSNRNKARRKVARIHAKISDSRNDHLHKISRRLINENQVVCVEDLATSNMVKNRKLAKSISDCGWSELVRQLVYKAEWAGRTVVKLDRFFPSSKLCSSCGHVKDSMSLSVRHWVCSECGAIHDRDENAAKNIKAAGCAVLACGESVRPIDEQSSLAVLSEAGIFTC